MNIKSISVTNFKSFKELEVKFDKFNVLIGANASGKSNFVQIFKFMKDIENHDLDNAISMQGGIEYLRNINLGSSEKFSLKVISNQKHDSIGGWEKEEIIEIKTYETTYEFALQFGEGGLGFNIAKDNLTQKCNFVRLHEGKKGKLSKKEKLGKGEIIFSRNKGKLKIDLKKSKEISIKKENLLPRFFQEEKLDCTPPTRHI